MSESLYKYSGLNDKDLTKLFTLLEKKPIEKVKQYINSAKELYNKNYLPVLEIVYSLYEIVLVRLWYFIKRKNNNPPDECKIEREGIIKVLSEKNGQRNVKTEEWKKAFGDKINNFKEFLEIDKYRDRARIYNWHRRRL